MTGVPAGWSGGLSRGIPRSRAERRPALLRGLPQPGAPLLVIVAKVPGIATDTDTAGMVVLYTAVSGALVYRELTPRAVLTSGAIVMTVATSQAFCSLVLMGGAGRMIQKLLLSISQNRYALPMVINVALLILGTAMDPLPVMLILSAILFPLTSGLGVDPEHLGDVTVFIPSQLLQDCRRRPHAPDPQSRGRRQVQHVAHYVVTADFGLALDKEGISEAAWDALPTEQQELLQTTFDEMEETAYSAAGNSGKEKDLAAWAEANGPDPVIDLDASSLAEQLAPLNARLANEACGGGAWATLQSPGAARAVPAPTRPDQSRGPVTRAPPGLSAASAPRRRRPRTTDPPTPIARASAPKAGSGRTSPPAPTPRDPRPARRAPHPRWGRCGAGNPTRSSRRARRRNLPRRRKAATRPR
ncbi:hypothetical protein CSE45_4842 [Citreicella sp. SE45]|nr:hypothetical protein CSE45_4842 [Citreicella sp. SE45]